VRRTRGESSLFANVRNVIALIVLAGLCIPVLKANASERRFTYTYESLVLNPGEIEIEPWTTFRIGKDDYFVRIDHRLEFEAGLPTRLPDAFSLTFHPAHP